MRPGAQERTKSLAVQLVTFNPDALSFASYRFDIAWLDSGVFQGTVRVQVRVVVPRGLDQAGPRSGPGAAPAPVGVCQWTGCLP